MTVYRYEQEQGGTYGWASKAVDKPVNGRYILDAVGEPVPCHDLETWAQWFETADRSLVRTQIGDVDVSTVFLGLDHNFNAKTPILWETLVFGGPLDGEMNRYYTRVEAQRGHDEMVARVRAQTNAGAGQ